MLIRRGMLSFYDDETVVKVGYSDVVNEID